MTQIAVQPKPFLRGHLHQAAFFWALGACSVLIAVAGGPRERLAAIVYSLSLAGLYGISSLYHRRQWGPKGRIWMRRLDHSAIFILMAGSATPVCLVGLHNESGEKLMIFFWIAAAFGILKELFWVNTHRFLTSIVYVAIGAVAVPYIPELATGLGHQRALLIIAGGVIYAAGAVVYALKKPDPFPRVFGYHEIFHALVVIASILHFIVIYQLVH